MFNKYQEFWRDECGAITVDWVVLTAAVVGFGALAYFFLSDPIEQMDTRTGQVLSDAEVRELSFD